jgi:hypothetical protein
MDLGDGARPAYSPVGLPFVTAITTSMSWTTHLGALLGEMGGNSDVEGVPLTLGVLMKWLNSIRGYHERFFVLDHVRGTLVYYKCHGEMKYQLPLALAARDTSQVRDASDLQAQLRDSSEGFRVPAPLSPACQHQGANRSE